MTDTVQDPRAALIRMAAFCEQTARDGHLPSLAWFTETAADLRHAADLLDAHTRQQQALKALVERLDAVHVDYRYHAGIQGGSTPRRGGSGEMHTCPICGPECSC